MLTACIKQRMPWRIVSGANVKYVDPTSRRVIVTLTSFALLDLTHVLLSTLITLNVPEQLTAVLRAERWDWTLLFRWDLGCNPPPCWMICSQRRGWRWRCHGILLSTGYNGITVDSIVVSGGYMNVWECGCTVGGMFYRTLLAWDGQMSWLIL